MKLALVLPCAASIAAIVLATPAMAQTPFDGTWKVDVASAQFGGKPIVRTLKDGTYHCASCSIPLTIKADGAFHPVSGNPYVDEESVTVVDAATVKFAYRLAGKSTGEETLVLSPDRATATFTGTDTSAANGTPVSYEVRQTRLAAAPAGAHAISGSWRPQPGGAVSDAGLTVAFKTQGKALTMSYPTGETVTADFGGPAAPISGDPGKSTVKFVRTGPSSFTSTSMRAGKVTGIATVKVAPDGRTLTYHNENKENGSTADYTATKQ